MPVRRAQDKTLIGRIQNKFLSFKTCVVKNFAAPSQTNRCLDGFFVSVSTANRIVHAVDVENTLDIEWDNAFDHSQVSPRVCKSF